MRGSSTGIGLAEVGPVEVDEGEGEELKLVLAVGAGRASKGDSGSGMPVLIVVLEREQGASKSFRQRRRSETKESESDAPCSPASFQVVAPFPPSPRAATRQPASTRHAQERMAKMSCTRRTRMRALRKEEAMVRCGRYGEGRGREKRQDDPSEPAGKKKKERRRRGKESLSSARRRRKGQLRCRQWVERGRGRRTLLRRVLNNLLSPPAFFCLSSSFCPDVLLVIPDAAARSLSPASSNLIAAVLDPNRSTSFSSLPLPETKLALGDDPLSGSSFPRVSTGLVGTLLVLPASRPSSLSSVFIGLLGFRRPARKRAARDLERFGLLAGEVSAGVHS